MFFGRMMKIYYKLLHFVWQYKRTTISIVWPYTADFIGRTWYSSWERHSHWRFWQEEKYIWLTCSNCCEKLDQCVCSVCMKKEAWGKQTTLMCKYCYLSCWLLHRVSAFSLKCQIMHTPHHYVVKILNGGGESVRAHAHMCVWNSTVGCSVMLFCLWCGLVTGFIHRRITTLGLPAREPMKY
jgi:hypothetical protein